MNPFPDLNRNRFEKFRNIADPYPIRNPIRCVRSGLGGRSTSIDNSPASPLPNSQTGDDQFKTDVPSVKAFCATLKQFFNNERLADATIRCGSQEFKVHAIVLSTHSEFFYKAFCGQWKESKDGKTINLEEVEVDVVKAMIEFMYRFDYNLPDGVSTLLFDAKVYSIADRYIIPSLKDYSKVKFQCAVRSLLDSDNLHSDLLTVSTEVYCSTPESDRGLRDSLAKTFHENLKKLEKNDSFHAALLEIPGLAVDMVFFKSKHVARPDNSQYYLPYNACRPGLQPRFPQQQWTPPLMQPEQAGFPFEYAPRPLQQAVPGNTPYPSTPQQLLSRGSSLVPQPLVPQQSQSTTAQDNQGTFTPQ
ncbi:BTB/POZ protein [Xylaria curta]|nr:BTB/POZ protein [Xylaria curta]